MMEKHSFLIADPRAWEGGIEGKISRGIICMNYIGPTRNLPVQEKRFPLTVTELIPQGQIGESLQVYRSNS